MERTRHLSLSEEDRARQKRAEFEKRLQGLLQRYEDGGLSVAAFLETFAELQSELKIDGDKMLQGGVLNRIDPQKNNEGWLALLAHVLPATCDPLRAELVRYREKMTALRSKTEERLLERLVRDHGISGPAVVPNPQKDTAHLKALANLKKETTHAIDAIFEHTQQQAAGNLLP
jgi:hypothetical protein